ncbi:hypothetical protein B0H11DRAFT_1683497, partial [Mycena galericulata]
PPTIPIVSNVLGNVILPGDTSVFTTTHFARHSAPGQLDRGVRSLVSRPQFCSKVGPWLELEPHRTCLPMLQVNPAL